MSGSIQETITAITAKIFAEVDVVCPQIKLSISQEQHLGYPDAIVAVVVVPRPNQKYNPFVFKFLLSTESFLDFSWTKLVEAVCRAFEEQDMYNRDHDIPVPLQRDVQRPEDTIDTRVKALLVKVLTPKELGVMIK